MSDDSPQISVLDARLAEIDRRLRSIQTGLVGGGASDQAALGAPEPELPPRVVVPEPGALGARRAQEGPRGEPAELIVGLRELAGIHERLLDSIRELLSAYEHALSRLPAGEPAPESARQVSVSAGPFQSTDALRGFEQALSRLPGVGEVEVRGYVGGDRAVVDVQLLPPAS